MFTLLILCVINFYENQTLHTLNRKRKRETEMLRIRNKIKIARQFKEYNFNF